MLGLAWLPTCVVVSNKYCSKQKMKLHINQTTTPLQRRVVVFLVFFIVISGILGPRIIEGNILFRDGFNIYGSVGKAMIFGLIAFVLLMRHAKFSVTILPWRKSSLGWIGAAAVLWAIAWLGIGGLLANHRTAQNLLMAHGGIIGGLSCAAIGCTGLENMRLLWRTFRREIITATAFAGVFYIFLSVVYSLWQPLAAVVLAGVHGLLSASGVPVVIIPPHTLLFDKFGVTIAEYCSGIESIALFTSLYAVVGLLDWPRIHKRRYFALFPFALLVLFALNIVRVYSLILTGYYINPHIAFSLFHTYAGMLFFIIYSGFFWWIAYRHLVAKEPAARKEKIS